jgi:hypothetical protein
MSDYRIVSPSGFIGYPNVDGPASSTSSGAAVPVGFRAEGYHSSFGKAEFVYAQNSDVASRGQFVHLINGSAVLLAAGNSVSANGIGVVAAGWTTTGTANYGWVQVKGYVDYARGTNSSIAAGQQLYVCAGTAGLLVTNVVTGNRVRGVVAPASYTSSQNASLSVVLNYPEIVGVADSRS